MVQNVQKTYDQVISREIELIAFDDGVATTPGRVAVSNGTRTLDNGEASAAKYISGAFLPRGPWRNATLEDVAIVQRRRLSGTDFVGIATIPDPILHPSQRERLLNYLMTRFRGSTSPTVHGVATNPPGLDTTTVDPARGLFLGLHLDSWDRRSLSNRHMSCNRISVNVGLEPRWLLFLNLSLMGMRETLNRAGIATQDEIPQSIGPAYMSAFPNHPVIRVLVKPGEAYIAPTDNMIHDGSSVGATGPGSHFTIRGQFLVD